MLGPACCVAAATIADQEAGPQHARRAGGPVDRGLVLRPGSSSYALSLTRRQRNHAQCPSVSHVRENRTQNGLPRGDNPVRWGGDEFLALLPGIDEVGLAAQLSGFTCWWRTPGSSRVGRSCGSPSQPGPRWLYLLTARWCGFGERDEEGTRGTSVTMSLRGSLAPIGPRLPATVGWGTLWSW